MRRLLLVLILALAMYSAGRVGYEIGFHDGWYKAVAADLGDEEDIDWKLYHELRSRI